MGKRPEMISEKLGLKKATYRGPKKGQAQSVSSVGSWIGNLQRAIGNQAVQSLFKSGHIYPKLKIGAPNDIYEQEADRVADQVMRKQDMTVSDRQSAFSKGTVSLQRNPG